MTEEAQAQWEELVLLTAQLDGVPAELVREHRSDDYGCCAGCKLPQSGNRVWPCTLFALGVAATEARAGRFRRLTGGAAEPACGAPPGQVTGPRR